MQFLPVGLIPWVMSCIEKPESSALSSDLAEPWVILWPVAGVEALGPVVAEGGD